MRGAQQLPGLTSGARRGAYTDAARCACHTQPSIQNGSAQARRVNAVQDPLQTELSHRSHCADRSVSHRAFDRYGSVQGGSAQAPHTTASASSIVRCTEHKERTVRIAQSVIVPSVAMGPVHEGNASTGSVPRRRAHCRTTRPAATSPPSPFATTCTSRAHSLPSVEYA
jgi:hypothetical protein